MRATVSLAIVLLAVVWADAQQANQLSAADRVRHLSANRGLLERMVLHSLSLSNANDLVNRSTACRAAVAELSIALDAAIAARDADRLAELGDHYALLVNDGLIPTLTEARDAVPVTSAEYARLKDLHKDSTSEIARLELSVPRNEMLGQSLSVKDTLAKWKAAATKLAIIFSD